MEQRLLPTNDRAFVEIFNGDNRVDYNEYVFDRKDGYYPLCDFRR